MAEKEYIERGALMVKLVRKFYPVIPTGSIAEHFCTAVLDTINNQRAADVVEVRHGKWIDVEVSDISSSNKLPFTDIASMRCDKCGRYHNEIYYYGSPVEQARYCPNCGAKMDGATDNNVGDKRR